MYTEEQITRAVEVMVDKWDLQTLIEYAVQERLDYYLGNNVDTDEIEELINDHNPTKEQS
jgi:hypothetical protein